MCHLNQKYNFTLYLLNTPTHTSLYLCVQTLHATLSQKVFFNVLISHHQALVIFFIGILIRMCTVTAYPKISFQCQCCVVRESLGMVILILYCRVCTSVSRDSCVHLWKMIVIARQMWWIPFTTCICLAHHIIM